MRTSAQATVCALIVAICLDANATAQTPETEDQRLQAQWKNLSDDDRDQLTRRHLEGLVRAAHAYADAHGAWPPAVVPNPKLPPEKRLSGFVLLLPYIATARPMQPKGADDFMFDKPTRELATRLAASIDLEKAWDDPANLPAAQTLFPPLLIPDGGALRDSRGRAVSHLAFVRGYDEDDGAFTDDTHVTTLGGARPISDGTSATLALAQVSEELGPWTAAGRATSRQLAPRDAAAAKCGAPQGQVVYAVNCDSFAYLLDLRTPEAALAALATMAAADLAQEEELIRFRTRSEAQAAR